MRQHGRLVFEPAVLLSRSISLSDPNILIEKWIPHPAHEAYTYGIKVVCMITLIFSQVPGSKTGESVMPEKCSIDFCSMRMPEKWMGGEKP